MPMKWLVEEMMSEIPDLSSWFTKGTHIMNVETDPLSLQPSNSQNSTISAFGIMAKYVIFENELKRKWI